MSTLISAAATAGPLAACWSVHTLWMRRRIEAARRDPLTGLLTRDGFTKRAAWLMNRTPVAVLVIDLDGFKAINDTHGHHAGDAILTQAARRLATTTVGGVRGRLGGDEFAAVIPLPDPVRLPARLRQTHEYLTAPVDFEGGELLIGASIGGVWSGTYPVDLSRVLRRADEAMYAVKRTGGGWMAATNPEPTQPSVNGRRAGRPGTGNAPEGATP